MKNEIKTKKVDKRMGKKTDGGKERGKEIMSFTYEKGRGKRGKEMTQR